MERGVAFGEDRLELVNSGTQLLDARLLFCVPGGALRHGLIEFGDPSREPLAVRLQIGRSRPGVLQLRVDAGSGFLRRSESGLDLGHPFLRGVPLVCDQFALALVQLRLRTRLV